MTWLADLPALRGKVLLDEPLAPFTWFRVGGPADALVLPADEEDLSAFLRALPLEVPVTVLGVGSNVIVRDRGVEGVVIRLAGRGFGRIDVDPQAGRIAAGAGVLDGQLARAAAEAGLAGLEFLAGVPGALGGALTMNAGCYGGQTADLLLEARGVDRRGEVRIFSPQELGYGYRHSAPPPGVIWTRATFRGTADAPQTIQARIAEITARREVSQPIREKTGGSTFKNPPGRSAWELVDAAGWRGRGLGGAVFSQLHANFMINTGEASAADLEQLGEAVRVDVKARFDVDLEWEIRRIGRPAR